MCRIFIAGVILYGWGHPSLDGHRPALLDRPLQTFYAEVNASARDGRSALAVLDDVRCMRYLAAHIERMGTQLRAAF